MAQQHLGPEFTVDEYLAAVLADLRAYFPGSAAVTIAHLAGAVQTLDDPPYIFLRLAEVVGETQSVARATFEATLHWAGEDGAATAIELVSWAHARMATHLGLDVRMEPGYISPASGLYVWPVAWDILLPYDYELRPDTPTGFRVRKITIQLRGADEVPLGEVVVG